jgi:hypothetical protein
MGKGQALLLSLPRRKDCPLGTRERESGTRVERGICSENRRYEVPWGKDRTGELLKEVSLLREKKLPQGRLLEVLGRGSVKRKSYFHDSMVGGRP